MKNAMLTTVAMVSLLAFTTPKVYATICTEGYSDKNCGKTTNPVPTTPVTPGAPSEKHALPTIPAPIVAPSPAPISPPSEKHVLTAPTPSPVAPAHDRSGEFPPVQQPVVHSRGVEHNTHLTHQQEEAKIRHNKEQQTRLLHQEEEHQAALRREEEHKVHVKHHTAYDNHESENELN